MRIFRKFLSLALVLSMLAGFAVMGGLPVASAKEETKTVVTATEEVKAEALEAEETYTDIVYYANGSTTWVGGDGKTTETAVKGSLSAVLAQVKADNEGSYANFPNGSRLVIMVTNGIASTGNQVFGGINDTLTRVDGSRLPILIQGERYEEGSAPKDSLICTYKPSNTGSAFMTFRNDVTIKNIKFSSNAYKPSGSDTYSDVITNTVYAHGSKVVFDNVTFAFDSKCPSETNKKWKVYADSKLPAADLEAAFDGSVTFLNGDYTALSVVAAQGADSWYRSDANGGSIYSSDYATATLTIGEGAVMGDVYGCYGGMQIKQVTVNLAGGSVTTYRGTQNGKETALRAYKTDLTTNVSGTTITTGYYGVGQYVDITADVVNNVTAGFGEKGFIGANTGTKITGSLTNYFGGTATCADFRGFLGKEINGDFTNTLDGKAVVNGYFRAATTTVNVNGNMTNNLLGGTVNAKSDVCLGGIGTTTVTGTLTNNMSGTTINVTADETNSSGVFFGGKSLTVTDLTNNVTGGTINYTDGRTDTSKSQKYTGVHFGPSSGTISGTLTNNVSGITVNGKLKAATTVFFGGQNLGWKCNKIVNTLGLEGVANSGPTFNTAANINLGGGWAVIGNTTASATEGLPETSVCSDEVAISNTVYDITMNTDKCLYGGSSSGYYLSGTTNYNHFTVGSIVNNIYGGNIGTFYGASGLAPIYGHVTTNIYGGKFTAINATAANSDIYDGVELHIYKASKNDGSAVNVSMKQYQATENAGSQALLSAVTPGRKAAVLTITPEVATDAVIGTITVPEDDATVSIDKGAFTKGLSVNGEAAAADMIAADRYIVSAADMTEISLADAVTTGCWITDELVTVKIHCDCGARTKDSDPTGNCKGACDGTLRTWQPWTSTSSLPKEATEAGFYYLTGDVTTTGQTSFKADADNTYTVFGIDLNGYNITHVVPANGAGSARALVAFGGYNATASDPSNTWVTDLILTDTAAEHGSVISDQRKLADGNTSQGNVLWVRHGNMSVYNVTVDGSDAKTTSTGATICVDSNRTLNMYNTTVKGGVCANGTKSTFGGAIYTKESTLVMEDCTVMGGQATYGGAIFAGANTTVTLIGTTVTDGKATSGGNIYCNPKSTVELIGSTVIDGTTGTTNTGANIHADGNFDNNQDNRSNLIITGGTVGLAKDEVARGIYITKVNVTVTGDAKLEDLYLRNGQLASQGHFNVDLTGLTEGAEVVYTPETYGRCAVATEQVLQYISTTKEYTANKDAIALDPTVEPIMAPAELTIEDGALVITRGCAAKLIHADKTETEYLTARAAAKAYVQGDILSMLYTFYDEIEAPAGLDLYLDIAGTTHRGTITLSEGNKLYLMDSATDTYGNQSANQYCAAEVLGGEIFTGTFKAPNAKRYLAENGRTDFETLGTYNKIFASRYYVGFTKLYLEPCKGSFNAGYRLEMAGNAKIKDKLSDTVGMKLWVGNDEANATEATIAKADFANKNTIVVKVTDLLGGDAAAQAAAATTDINAKAVGSLNGEEFEATVAFNLKQMVEAADAAYATLTADQQSCLKVCYKRYQSLMSTWNLTNIK